MTENLNFLGYPSTFEIEDTSTCGSFKSKTNALTLPEQLQKNFKKVPKMTFFGLKYAPPPPPPPHHPLNSRSALGFRAYAGPRRRRIVREQFAASESLHFRSENNAQTTSEQLQTNFQKPPKTVFWPPKWSK